MRRREIDEAVGHAVIGLKRRGAHMKPFHLVFGHQRSDFPDQELGERIAGQELRGHRGAAITNPAGAGDIPEWLFDLICRQEWRGAAQTGARRQPSGENRTTAHSMHDDPLSLSPKRKKRSTEPPPGSPPGSELPPHRWLQLS